jgi:hypothetical protein
MSTGDDNRSIYQETCNLVYGALNATIPFATSEEGRWSTAAQNLPVIMRDIQGKPLKAHPHLKESVFFVVAITLQVVAHDKSSSKLLARDLRGVVSTTFFRGDWSSG